MKNINDVLLHPIRMRILQQYSKKETLTATEICHALSDVPRTTLYRHINTLIEAEMLTVISEKKIRGSYERTLALNIETYSKHNTLENADQNAYHFLMTQYAKFHNYFSKASIDPARDKIFLSNIALMMTDDEYDAFLVKLQALLKESNNDFGVGRKIRDISILSSPTDT